MAGFRSVSVFQSRICVTLGCPGTIVRPFVMFVAVRVCDWFAGKSAF